MMIQPVIPDNRELTPSERTLISWLLHHGYEGASEFLPQLGHARVTSRCGCGCASIDFAIDGKVPQIGQPISILSDFEWSDSDGHLFGTFVFERCGQLAGLDIWSQDGLEKADMLPQIDDLRPVGEAARPDSNGIDRSSIEAGCVALTVSSNP